MARARRDQNYVTTLVGVSFSDLETPELLAVDPTNNRLLVSSILTSDTSTVYKKLIDDTTTASVTYIGEAALGTATSAASWRIQKIDETSGVAITWTGTGFDAVWDDRVTESYS